MVIKNFLNLCLLILLTACGSGNQGLVDDFFDINGEDESKTGTLNYSTTELREAVANDGSIENTISIELVGRNFVGAVGEEFIGTKLIVTNLPAGLSISAQFVDEKEVLVTVSGNADDHDNVDDISNVTFDFDDTAFNIATDIAGQQTLVSVNYRDPYSLSYDSTLINESGANDGSFIESYNISVNDLEFSGNTGDDFVSSGKVTITNTPSGTTGTATKVGDSIIAISLSGNATNHATTDDISNLTVIVNSTAFETGVSSGVVANTTKNDLGVNFSDPGSLSYLPLTETFSESIANIGGINNQLTITVTEDTFSGNIGDDYVSSGKAIVSNLPAGLGASVTKITSTSVSVTLTGSAVNHADANDIANLTVNFSANAFDFNTSISNVLNSQKSDITIDYLDPYTLSFDTKSFDESGANDGTITDTATVTLIGTDFTENIGDDLVSSGAVTIVNLPAGLTATVIKSSANTATVSLSGTALNHESANNISNVSMNFEDSAFLSGAAAGVDGSDNSDISISFKDPVSISYSGSSLFESSANDGSVSNFIDIFVANDTFTGTNGENFLSNGKASLSPNPVTTGLASVVERISNTQVRLYLTGNATANDVDISGITLIFDPTALTESTSIVSIDGAIKNNIVLDFIDVLTFASTSVDERAENDGQIDETVIISLTGTTFTGANSDDFVADGKIVVTNVPAGLSLSLTRSTSTTLSLSFSGTASSHTSSDDVSNINILFQNTAFSSGSASSVENNATSDFSISYLDPVTLSYDTSVFIEAVANDGSISNSINITLAGDTFTGSVSEDYLLGSKVVLTPAIPAGLTASLVRVSATNLLFTLSGNATVHDIDQGPFTLTFDDSAFDINTNTTNIVNVSKNDILINYNDSLSYSDLAFTERAQNDGQIDTVSTINLTGTTFTGVNGENFLVSSKVIISNVPAGLTASVVKTSDTQVLFSLTGTATNHTSVDDISNLSIAFDNSAFINNSANSVGNNSLNTLTISYLDPVILSYSTDTFLENSVNDGSISNTIDITLTNDTFTGSNGDDFISVKSTISNVPSGLTASLIRVDSTTLRLTLSGNASSNDTDLSNVGLLLDASAFTVTTDTTNVVNVNKIDIAIDYYDLLTYSTDTLTERALNDGQVDQTVSISLTGTSLSGINGDDFISQGKVSVANVPSGLTASLIRNSSSSLTLSFSGTAINHESADSVSTVTFSFLDSALNSSLASSLENATVNDFEINFFDSVAISYSSDTFSENLSNSGEIDNTITLTAVNDTFLGSSGDDFIVNGLATVINVPAGLTASLIRTSSSVLQFSLTGNAIDHGDIHDISNLSLEIKPSALAITTNTTNVLNAVKADISVDYISPSSFVYDTLAFEESSSNDGSISNAINVDIDGLDSFTGLIGDDFVSNGKATVTNIPAGFSVTLIKTASKQVRFTLVGNALAHEAVNSVANIGIAFNSTALTFNNDISLVTDNSQSAIEANYVDAASLTYSTVTLNESIGNVGAVTETIDIDLLNDTFVGLAGEDFLGTGKVVISNVPSGLVPSLQRISSTKVTLTLTGNAGSHDLADSVSNLTIKFQASAFTFNTDVSTVGNGEKSDLEISFLDPYALTYSASTFSETSANTGELSGASSISLGGTTFAGSIGDNFVSNGFVTVQNLPAGLTAVVEKTASNQVVFTLTGNAISNAIIHNIANLGITFQSAAFSSGDSLGVTDSSKSDFIVSYIDPYSLSWSGLSVEENIQNIGTITEVITITLNGHTFSGTDGDNFIVAGRVVMTNVPSGLTASVIRNSSTELELSYTGTASSHINSDDIDNITFALQDSALTDGALAANVIDGFESDLEIDFLPPYTLSSNGSSFDEDGANDGSVSDTITYTLVGTTFAGADGRDLFADGHVSLSSVPAGLTPVVTKGDTNNVTLSFTGNALNHAVVDNTASTAIEFLAGAFTSNNASGVTPNDYSGMSFSWDDPPALSYSPTILNESTANIGGTTTSVSIFAANKTFVGSLGEDFVASGKVIISSFPAGLNPVVTYASANQVNLTFTGNATAHADSDDIATGISVSFNDSAYVGGNAAQVVNGTFTALGMDFVDPYFLNYASTNFEESSLNDGSIASSISITVSGTLFAGSIGEEYVASSKAVVNNIPAGLTATVTKLSTSLVEVTLSGNASDHEVVDNITDLEVVFADSAFTSGAAAGVTDSTKSDISVSYNNTATVIYGSSTLAEAATNVGNISTTVAISITEDTFSGPDGENFISTGKIAASNVPVGLVAQVLKTSDTTLEFNLIGSAVAHENVHDVSDVTLSFAGSAFDFNSNSLAVINSVKSDFNVDYINAYELSYVSDIFSEANLNDGSIGNILTINLVGTTFDGTDGDDFVSDSKVTVSNLPAGLTAVMTKTSDNVMTMSLTGNATSHINSNDLSSVGVIFADSAFTSGRSEGVTGYIKSDISIDFDDAPFLTYVSSIFNEAVSNIGAVSTTVDITLTNTTFSGSDLDIYTAGNQITFSNIPFGLTAQAQKIDATTVRISFTGSASSHGATDSVTNFGVQFNNSAFNFVTASNITDNSKSDYAITFINPYSISYSGNIFTENATNIGAISSSVDITVAGTTFNGVDGVVYTNGTDATFLNIPSGMTPALTKINDTTIRLTLSGNASAHALANSSTSFGISLQDSIFTSGAAAGVSNNTKIDFNVNFIDPYSITYSSVGFQEAASNDGQISSTLSIDLVDTTFSGVNGGNYTLGDEYTINNLPTGLTAVLFKVSSTQLTLFFTGSADNHENVNDISNLTISLTDNAFTTGASAGVANNSKSDLIIDFIDGATLAYSGATLSESIANIGSIDNTLTVTLANDTFTGVNGENYVSSSKAVVSNIPAGLLASVTKVSDSTVDITLTGSANNHLDADDISDLTVTFNASAFTFNSDATTITNYLKSDIAVDFDDQYSLAYAPEIFSEAAANDGSIGNNVVITLTGSTFTTTASNFISEGKVAVTNIPGGLSANVVRNSATQLTLSLTGNATNNLDSNDISNLTVAFTDTAFTTGASAGVDDSVKGDLSVDFEDQPAIIFASSTFSESTPNIGGSTDTININLTGATFSGTIGAFLAEGTEFNVTNVPGGLSASVQKISDTQLRLSLSGAATSHSASDSVANIGITLTDDAFNVITAANVTNNSKSDFVMSFINPYSLTYSGSAFSESISNTGAIDSTININISGTTFTGSNGTNYTDGVEYSFSNLPSGLGVQVQRVTDTQLELSFTSAASAHAFADSITDFTLNILDAAFASGAAAGVNDTTKSDFSIGFVDPYTIAYSGSNFVEDGANDGSISTLIDLELTGTTFTGTNGVDYALSTQYTVANVPAGLTFKVNKLNSTTLRVSLSGNAGSHASANDVTNLTLTLSDSAFTSGAASGVVPSSKTDFVINYTDNATLAYSTSTFTEDVANIGSISNTILITLTNDIFTGTNGDNFISSGRASVANLPAGLTISVNKISDTSVSLILTGEATANLNADDVSDLTVNFSASAFDFNTNIATIINASKNDIVIDYIDQYSMAYAPTLFTEAAANDGSVDTTIVATLTGSTFTTTATDFISEGKVSLVNVPAGLVAVATRDSATQITFSFTSNASNHANSNDISNLEIVFSDTAFVTGSAAGVDDSTISTVEVDFDDPPTLSYVSSIFSEADSNVGAVSTTINVNLSDATFSGADDVFYTENTQFIASNVPAGLDLKVEKKSDTQVQLTLSGTATSHGVTNNISNIGIQFTDSAFNTVTAANVNNNSKSDFSISFRDPYTLAYSGSAFSESVGNTGGVDTTVNITVSGTTFEGNDGDVYSSGIDFSSGNLPSGLVVQVKKISDTIAQLSFTSSASDHALSDSITDFTLNLLDSIFTSGAAAGVSDTTKADFSISFIDPYSIAYSAAGFNEAGTNNGSVIETVDLEITGTTFTGTNGAALTENTDYTVANEPTGLNLVVTKINSTTLRLSLSGSASDHESSDNVSNLTINLEDVAFTSGSAAGVTGSSKSDLTVDYADNASLAYSATTFSEAVSNIGEISNVVTITLANDIFTGTNGENYISSGKASVANLPSGLTASIDKVSDTTVTMTLSGQATSNLNTHDVSDLTVTFNASAFDFNTDASTILNSSRSDLIIDYIDQYSMAYVPTVFTESGLNDGSVDSTVVVTLTGSTFTTTASDFLSESKVSLSNVPAGLVAVATRDSATQMTFSFTGNASNHASSNNISNLGIAFADSAFDTGAAAGVDDSSISTLSIDFIDPPVLTYVSSIFSEADSNVGAVSTSINVNLSDANFSGTDSVFYTENTQFIASNVPAGLDLKVQKISNTQVQLTLSGAATSHGVSNNISTIGIQFTDSAFVTVAAANVNNNSKSDFSISFRDPYTLAYSGSAFSESVGNTGGVDTTVNITVSGTTFTGSNGDIYLSGTHYSSGNLPSGLVVQVEKISDTIAQLRFTSAASDHALSDSITNFTLNLLDSVFASGAAAGVSDTTKADFSISFIDPYSIAYSAAGFNEAGTNNGSVTETVDLEITGTTFTGTNGVALVEGTGYTVINEPSGLDLVVTKINSTTLRLSLIGNASDHESSDNITNLTINLQNVAFTSGSAAGVTGSSKADLEIDYVDNASIAYSLSTFTESNSNIGEISNTLTLTLSDDTFTGVNGENFVSSSKVSITNIPSGLAASATRSSDTEILIELSGNADVHLSSDDIADLTVTFNANAFTFNTDETTVGNYMKSDIAVDFMDQYLLTYSASIFTEGAANDGSIANSVTLTLTGSAFTTTASDFITESKVAVTNIPSGLVADVTRLDANNLTLSFTGKATNNLDSNDISNLTVTFADTAFTTGAAGGVDNAIKSDISVDFENQPILAYSSSTFVEADSNVGAVSGSVIVDLSGATFSGGDGSFYTNSNQFSVSNVPAGLVTIVQKISNTQVEITFNNAATSHALSNSISNMGIQFNDSAFNLVASADITDNSKSNFAINFRDPYTLAYSGSAFSESVANIGGIDTTVNITVAGTTFEGSDGAIYSSGTHYSSINLPANLTVQVRKSNSTQLELSFTGEATSHALADSISNFTLNLLGAAFASGDAAGVTDTTKSDFSISFIDPYSVSYASSTFSEDGLNNGSITETIDISLTGTSFSGTDGVAYSSTTEYSVANVPAGLTIALTKISSTTVRVSFSGTANNHEDINDISDLEINLLDAAFISGSAAGVNGSSNSTLAIDFTNTASLAYSSLVFDEATSNIGELDTTITITISNDTFAGLDGENYASTGKGSVSGLPAGLLGAITKTSDTTVDVTLTGQALFHANTDSISTIGVTFSSSAFDFNSSAASVTDSSRADMSLDFIDPYVLNYSIGGLTEAAANDGSMGNNIIITLTGGSAFATTGSDFINDGKVAVTNVPAGLSAVITRDSAVQVTLSLTGNATNNADSNDISTLSIVFDDTAFTTGESLGVTGSTKTNLFIDFNNQPSITYAASNLTEAASNTGLIDGSIDIDILNDTFTGTDGDIYTGTKVTVAGLPSGLDSNIEKISDTKLRLTYTGSATAHEIANNASGISLSFLNAAFTNVGASNIEDSSKSDFSITFRDPYTLSYSTSNFNEAVSNDGQVTSTVDVTVTGTTFTGVDASTYTLTTDFSVSAEPAGLTTVVTKIDDTTIQISFTGSADDHDDIDDVAGFGITFNDSMFTSGESDGVNNTTKSDFIIDYLAPASLAYSTLSLSESNLNNGTVTETITIDLTNDTFSGAISSDLIGNGDISITNLPNNFVAIATKSTSNRLIVSLTGNATSHANTDDLSNIELLFAASAFTNNTVAANVTNYEVTNIAIDFEDPYIISYGSTSVSESGANIGAISETITINLVGTTFTGTDGDNFAGTKATFGNVPSGLAPSLIKDNNNQLTLSFTGTASPHTDSEDVSNVSVTFLDGAFSSGAAAGVNNSSVSNISIDFNELAGISYASSTFNEAISNIGAITETVVLTLTEDTFTGTNGDDFASNGNATVTNIPDGLDVKLLRSGDNTLTMSFNNTATFHGNGNDVSDITVVFNASSFTFNTNASLVTNSTKSDIAIDYEDPYSLTYTAGTLNEDNANDGSISETININLTGTTFTGNDGDNFSGGKALVTNVPAGLTAVLERKASGQVQLSFTGNATNNEDTHDVSNVQVAFGDSAFTSNAALGVTNSTKSDIGIDFVDRPIISFSASTLQEDVSNVGTFSTELVIDISGELFASGSFDASKVGVTNLPAGLGSTVSRISDTQVSVAITGTASPHTTAEDVSNVTVTFEDAAFQNVAASNITNSTNGSTSITFRDPYVLAFSGSTFQESVNNDGSIATSIIANISGTSFDVPSVDMLSDGMVTINNIPSLLTANVVRNSSTQVTINLAGNASVHADINDISNLEIIFNDSAFVSGESDGVTGSSKLDFIVDYLDPASLAYSTATLSENTSNDGSLSNFIDITLSADTFTGTGSGVDDFAGSKANISGVPFGLTATLFRQSSTVVRLELTGEASDHESSNDVSNLSVEFLAGAFTNNTIAANVANYNRSDLVIDFIDAYQLTYSVDSLDEAIANDGSISATLNIALTGTTFAAGTDFITELKVASTNHSTGLTPVLTRVDGTNLTLSFTGAATVHELANSVSALTLTFADSAFVTGNADDVVNYNKADLSLNFKDQAVISYSTNTFNESSTNDGSIGNSINISISDDEFTGANTSDFLADGKATIANVPAAYTATLVKISGSTLTLSLSGAVANGDHENADDISNIEVVFLDTAVASARADLISNSTKSDVEIDYSDVVLPAISAITPPTDGYYTLGQNLSFTVAYSGDVDVVGTPRIVFDIDGTTVYADYTGGTGTSTLIFEYVTVASQQDLDGITISSSTIDLNGGTIKIKDDAINNALVSFTVPNTTGIFVDTITPNAISGLTLGSDGTDAGDESPVVTWTNPIVSTDNIDHIEIALGTAAGANNTIDYMDIGDVETFQFTGVSPAFTECISGSPLYYPVVRVHDDANNISSTISDTDGFLFDSIDPVAPGISDVTFDADNTRSATIVWTAGTDVCGVANYEMSIGEDLDSSGTLEAGEIGNIQGWTDVGNTTTANLSGLTLNDNVNYHTAIRTIDVTGRESTYVVSSVWRANFNYRRNVAIAPTTTVADSHVKITLNSSSFTYANVGDDLEDLRFFTDPTIGDPLGVELAYWIEYHDPADETRIWVKIPDTGTSNIVMKYGTENLSDGQDKTATFSFDAEEDLYVAISGNANSQTLNVASYINGNSVTVGTASSTNLVINEGNVGSFTSVEDVLISANGGISARVLDDNPAYEAIIPLSEAATDFGFTTSRRNNDKYKFYNPNSTAATVTTTAYNGGGNAVGAVQTTVVPAFSFAEDTDVDTSNGGIVLVNSSTLPVVGYYVGSNNTTYNYDGNVQPQATTEIFGVPSSTGYVSCTQNGTTFTVYRSSNSLVSQNSYTCNDGQRVNISDSSYSQGLAPAIRVVANQPIFGTSTADSDGLESASFMGLDSLDRDYIIPANSEYAVMACPYDDTDIEVFDQTGTSVYTNSCNANGNFPGKDKLLATQFGLGRMPPGYRIKANKPFFMMYEYENQDETSIYGGKSARKYLETPLVPTVSGTEY